ncbi:hypothetical protein CRUP_034524 [Coryphaenoides rupestris]|nr:hypothetical protein CRUP_034524 [Coryphaenoides rupestris]
MNITASFVVFNPQPGQKLQGIVNKLGVSHVGCLVHGCFNASVPKPNLIPVVTWRDVGPRIGAELEVQEMLAMAETIIPEDQPLPLSQLPDTGPEPGPEVTPKKKKKKKRDKQQSLEAELDGLAASDSRLEEFSADTVKQEREEEEAAAWTAAQANCQPDGTPASEKKKKKKKKKTKNPETETCPKEESDEVVVTAALEPHCSDSSGYLSDKPSRKRRLEAVPELCSTAEPQTPPKSKKKKRKSEVQEFA